MEHNGFGQRQAHWPYGVRCLVPRGSLGDDGFSCSERVSRIRDTTTFFWVNVQFRRGSCRNFHSIIMQRYARYQTQRECAWGARNRLGGYRRLPGQPASRGSRGSLRETRLVRHPIVADTLCLLLPVSYDVLTERIVGGVQAECVLLEVLL